MSKLSSFKFSLIEWIIGFTGILFIRFFLESLSIKNSSGFLPSDVLTLVHYYLFYLGLLLSLVLLARKFLPYTTAQLLAVSLWVLPIIWLAPLVDLLFGGIGNMPMAYIFQGGLGLVKSFVTFLGPWQLPGITLGIRLEVLLILIFVGYLVQTTHHNWRKTLGALIAGYAIFWGWLAFPSLVKFLADLVYGKIITAQPNEIAFFFNQLTSNSILAKNLFNPAIGFSSEPVRYEQFFNAVMSQLFIFLDVSLLIALFWRGLKEKILAVFRNSRPERVAYYFSWIIFGEVLAYKQNLHFRMHWNLFDLTSIALLFFSYYCAWMFSVGVNDIRDYRIDAVSNPDRPLVSQSLSFAEMKYFNLLWLGWALISALVVGQYQFFFVLTFIFAYHLYSSAPLRLKRPFIISTFLIALATLSVTLAGFFLFRVDKEMAALPYGLIIFILIAITLIANVKDLKDMLGDRQEGIKTLPVIYGEAKAKKIIGIFFIVAYLLEPLFLGKLGLLLPALAVGIISYLVIQREDFKERWVFYLFFFYQLIALLII